MNSNSQIISNIARVLLPFVIIYGIYIVLSGANSIGGGFQGGAVLSAAFILLYLIRPDKEVNIILLGKIEKVFMVALLCFVFIFMARDMDFGRVWGQVWIMVLNAIIAIKVCCGLSIIFYRYVFYEGR